LSSIEQIQNDLEDILTWKKSFDPNKMKEEFEKKFALQELLSKNR